MACLKWLHGEIKAEYSQSHRIWGTCLYYGPGTDRFGVPRLRPDWLIKTQKDQGFSEIYKVLSKGHKL